MTSEERNALNEKIIALGIKNKFQAIVQVKIATQWPAADCRIYTDNILRNHSLTNPIPTFTQSERDQFALDQIRKHMIVVNYHAKIKDGLLGYEVDLDSLNQEIKIRP